MKKIINVIGNDYDVFEDLERNQFIINGYFSNKNKLNGYKYLGSDKNINKFEHKTILSADDPDFREFIYKKYKKNF
jgi:hypothetical protein